MGRLCSICSHSERTKIEAAIVDNVTYRHIASQFDVGYKSVERHKDNCMQAAIQSVKLQQAEQTAQVVEKAEEKREQFVWNLFGRIEWLDRQIRQTYEKASATGDLKASISALGEVRQQTKLFNELLQGQEPGQAEKLEAEWIAVREAIFNALEPFPEARLAVARALLALRDRDDYQSDRQLLQAESPDSIS